MSAPTLPLLYADLAAWWPLFSSPDDEDYDREAAWVLNALSDTLGRRPAQILELGSGGGNVASYLTPHARMVLSDVSPGMLDVSRRLNPEAEHIEGDMRNLRLGRTFDAVMIHDAIMYMTTLDDLVAALSTARAHLQPGGALVVLPDHVAETFEPSTETGGHDARDGSRRGLRYVWWAHPLEAGATMHDNDVAMMLRAADGSVQVFHDRHREGVFRRDTWREAFVRAVFAEPRILHDPWGRDVFIARPLAAVAGNS